MFSVEMAYWIGRISLDQLHNRKGILTFRFLLIFLRKRKARIFSSVSLLKSFNLCNVEKTNTSENLYDWRKHSLCGENLVRLTYKFLIWTPGCNYFQKRLCMRIHSHSYSYAYTRIPMRVNTLLAVSYTHLATSELASRYGLK